MSRASSRSDAYDGAGAAAGALRVLLVSNTFPPGDISGVGTLVAELLRQLRGAGHGAIALVRRAPPGGEAGVVAVGGGKLWFPFRAALALPRAAGGFPFDIVHVHESDGVFVILRQRLARLLGRPSGRARLVATLQVSYRRERWAVRAVRSNGRVVSRPAQSEWVFKFLRAPLHAALGRLTVWLADAVVAPSAATARELEADYGARGVQVIPNGIALPAAAPPSRAQDGETILFVGRLRTRKAVAVLFEAFAEVAAARPRARLVVLGDGEQRAALEAQRARLGLESRVDLRGAVPREETARWLREADIFCLPSTYEGFPLAILEAMAQGLPVVATRVAGVPEAIEEGASGLVVDAEDGRALAAALVALLSDPDRRGRYGTRGRELLAERFSIADVSARYVERFSLLARKGRAA